MNTRLTKSSKEADGEIYNPNSSGKTGVQRSDSTELLITGQTMQMLKASDDERFQSEIQICEAQISTSYEVSMK